jgi:hypothetical protein
VDPPADSFPSWSPYNYVFNNPAGLRDPDGRCPEDDQTCWQLVQFLRSFNGEILNDAADRLAKYQGRVFLTDAAYSGSTNATTMFLRMGGTMERTPEGYLMMKPGKGDLALLLVHETLHLSEDGSFAGLKHPGTGLDHTYWDPPFAERKRKAFLELNPHDDYAPIYIMRRNIRRGR